MVEAMLFPYFFNDTITKAEYASILKRAVPKVSSMMMIIIIFFYYNDN